MSRNGQMPAAAPERVFGTRGLSEGRLLCNVRLDAALEYAARGWRVFPVHTIRGGECTCGGRKGCKPGKHPLTDHGFKDATTDSKQIRRWWAKWPEANIGIATGKASGIIVLDIDPRNGGDQALAELESQHGSLPHTVEAISGGGGRHILLQYPGYHIKSRSGLWPGIDVKADGGYFVAEPSVHESGREYAWELSHLPSDVAVALIPQWLLQRFEEGSSSKNRETEVTERTEWSKTNHSVSQSPSVSSVLSVLSVHSVLSVFSVSNQDAVTIVQAISATIPAARGQRHDCVFAFCRHLRGIPAIAEAAFGDLKPIVKLWHQQAYPVIGTKPFEATWGDFVTAYPSVRFPIGEGPLDIILTAADQSMTPACADEYESRDMVRLVKLCRELQRVAGDAPFFLSCRTAGKLLGIVHTSAWKLMRVLVVDRILQVEQRGTTAKAARYRYVAETVAEPADSVQKSLPCSPDPR